VNRHCQPSPRKVSNLSRNAYKQRTCWRWWRPRLDSNQRPSAMGWKAAQSGLRRMKKLKESRRTGYRGRTSAAGFSVGAASMWFRDFLTHRVFLSIPCS
jgi:hypothetical protein